MTLPKECVDALFDYIQSTGDAKLLMHEQMHHIGDKTVPKNINSLYNAKVGRQWDAGDKLKAACTASK
jgi:hypothetical protein